MEIKIYLDQKLRDIAQGESDLIHVPSLDSLKNTFGNHSRVYLF